MFMLILQSNHSHVMTSFVSNVIISMVRRNLDLISDNIIEEIRTKFYITVLYNKAWNIRTNVLLKIFRD